MENKNISQNQSDLNLLKKTCLETGKILMEYFGTSLDVEIKEEAGNSPVTIADKKADAYLQKHLLKARPNYGWISEETEQDGSHHNAERFFVVDPIDGTKPFIKGLPEFCISAAIVENHQPIVGVVYNPASKEMFTCIRGEGVCINDEKVVLEDIENIQTFLGSISENRKGYLEALAFGWDIKTVGSAAYKMALVSVGKGDITATFRPKSAWDIAAGHLMCEEAGFKVADFDSQVPNYAFENADSFINHLLVAPESKFGTFAKEMKQKMLEVRAR